MQKCRIQFDESGDEGMADFLEAAATLSPTAEQSPMASSVIEATEEVIHPPLGIPEGPSATELLPEEGG